MNQHDALKAALRASGNDAGLALADAFLSPTPPAPGAAEAPTPLVASAADDSNAAALTAAAAGGQSDRERYDRLSAEQLADLSEPEYRKALRVLLGKD